MKTAKLLAIISIAFLLTGTIALAEYATTKVYFNIPIATQFNIRMPSAYTVIDITGTSEATATSTSWISFNFSKSSSDSWLEPSVTGDFAKNQSGTSQPIFMIENDGSVNQTFTIYYNETPDDGTWPGSSGLNISVNGTCNDLSYCVSPLTTATNMSDSALKFVEDLWPSTSYHFNLTMWGFKESSVTGGTYTANIITNSSDSS